jgi:hypothetical protein
MGMFGRGAGYAPQADLAKLSFADRARIFGIAMTDPGSAMQMKQQMRAAPARDAFLKSLQDRVTGTPDSVSQAQIGNSAGQDISAAFAPQYDLKPGQAPIDINSPDLPALAMRAQTLGVPIGQLLDVLKAQQPNVDIGPGGEAYNKNDRSVIGRRFRNPANVNGFIVDQNKPENEGAYFPKLPDGVIPNGKGGVDNITGLIPSMQGQEEAQALGRTRGTMMNVPTRSGAPAMMTGAQFLGGQGGGAGGGGAQSQGFGVGQAPSEAAYENDLAKASATQYTGIQTAGVNAAKQIQTYGRIKNLLAGVDGGRLSPAGVEIASAANSLGIKIDPNLGNKQAAQALMNQIVLDANGGSLGPGVSNADVAFLAKAGPNLMQSADGRQKVLDFAVARAQRTQKVAQFARQWQSKGGRLDKPDRNGKTFYDYMDAYAGANPLLPEGQ